MWRQEFAYRAETAVLVTSLQHLADIHTLGRRALIELPCVRWVIAWSRAPART
jgi:hypothetical protein